MKNMDNIKFLISLSLFLLPILSEELKKYPSLAWSSAGIGAVLAFMTNARGVFLIKHLLNFSFPAKKESNDGNEENIIDDTLDGDDSLTSLKKRVRLGQWLRHLEKPKDELKDMVLRHCGDNTITKPLDGKVTGVLYKNKDGSEIPRDEFIVFRPHDDAFFFTLPIYRDTCINMGASDVQIAAINYLISKVRIWRNKNPDRCKVPDCDLDEAPKGW